METVKLSDGREIGIDLLKISLAEFRLLVGKKLSQPEEDVMMARVYGMQVEDYQNLPYPDFRLLTFRFFQLASKPLADPNYLSESSST